MICAAGLTTFKVYKGSKSAFAYILLAFTFGNGIVNVGFFLTDAIKTTKVLGKTVYHFASFKAVSWVGYTYYLMSIQAWIFSFRYLDSAINSSPQKFIISPICLKVIFWDGIIIYSLLLIGQLIWLLVTFPGYINDYSLNEYLEWS
jgi:hypothetical protein